MSRCVVLDAEALAALGRAGHRGLEVRAALRAAARLRREVVVPSVILAELYRGPRHSSLVDACLSRETGIRVRDTDRPLARIVGGGLALTVDVEDLSRLAASYGNVTIVGLP